MRPALRPTCPSLCDAETALNFYLAAQAPAPAPSPHPMQLQYQQQCLTDPLFAHPRYRKICDLNRCARTSCQAAQPAAPPSSLWLQ